MKKERRGEKDRRQEVRTELIEKNYQWKKKRMEHKRGGRREAAAHKSLSSYKLLLSVLNPSIKTVKKIR